MPFPTLFLSPSLPPSLSPATHPAPADRATKEGQTSAVQKRKRARHRLQGEEDDGLFPAYAAKRVNEVDAQADPQEWEAQALRERRVRGQVKQHVWIMLKDVDHLRVLLHSLHGDDGGVSAEGQVVRILKSTLFEYSI